MRVPTHAVILPVALAAMLVGVVPGAAKDKLQQKNERKQAAADMLDKLPESNSLRWNASQLQTWARYEGDDVLPRLLQIYEKPPAPFENNMRYLAAAAFRNRHDIPNATPDDDIRRFNVRIEPTPADIAALRKFIKANYRHAEEIWGVYCAACILALEDDPDIGMELLEFVADRKSPAVIRAAMIEALAHGGFEYLRRALEVMLQEDFKKSEGAVMFEAICWAAARAYRPLWKPKEPVSKEWRVVFDCIAAIMEDEDNTMGRSVREAALAMQFCFGTKYPYQYASMWRLLFENGLDPLGDDDGRTFATFMGLDVLGDRIVFLIDASDSMLNPLSDEDLETLKNPVTGEKRKGKKDDSYEIDWKRVRNRFDAAREHVKWTVSRLPKDKQVCVILFGDNAEPLGITNGFISASKINAKRINGSLDAVRPKDAPDEMKSKRPYGVLMGETNYYQALLSAYRMGRGGVLDAPREGYDLKLITEGADAIFVLSDGAPIRDGFRGRTPKIDYEFVSYREYDSQQPGEGQWVEIPARPATPEREIEQRDPETGAITKIKVPGYPAQPARKVWRKKETVSYQFDDLDDNGPYADESSGMFFIGGSSLNNLRDEIERMNLVRRCRIQCVGIGEAQMGWLRPIAVKTGGKAVYFGKEGEREANPGGIPGFPKDD
ncbi:MAG: VWA domain-containing protein [Planctomycetes bacterium]|nr:VWA domain-containing protein [Planctomycetota bacterium]